MSEPGAQLSHASDRSRSTRKSTKARTLAAARGPSGWTTWTGTGGVDGDLNPRAGLLFVDFASGGLLSLTGEAEVVWNGPELSAFAGAQRLLRFRVAEGVWIEDAVPLRWSAPVAAPQLAATGTWEDVERATAA
ncbi:hypothetical protein [Sorangium cellulosum]|uniref:Uncharacterized protein n=1 Tax=Sorangium cellulosum TaxID=56 RepID=A0A150QT01_SORCE|nr:hypothetical protein [Sorangium cellulosum]KYF70972.1 hypothetical protein BE15_08290 [Sorangium cellulosum]